MSFFSKKKEEEIIEPNFQKIVDGKFYSTAASRRVCMQNWFHEVYREVLYQTNNGQYFIAFVSGPRNKPKIYDIELISKKKAKKWMAEYTDVSDYINEFGNVEIG